ncbi:MULTISPECIES: choline ABC transporter ATP-binding protein [Vibrio]|jgi:glycine betaine/proline transport system ATP-binding protein|uniref:Choline ABC transporter ATP-binding protein n=1 Tax=Vibrio natriegens NBRC 15636 = ATCC 14048 = DSM 759 TaxID=1219067 RepID=A0AAN1CY61_VIBNA|nr:MULTISPECIES: choline ABC transporter ATP-binding protein [Vibrio]MEE3876517.1 choline ABC transporter ATP-binding protein [Vibrio sp. YYF0003]AEX24141.1 L-proline Glycine Betaine ABC transport ATP-binding protein proV [Vibrio sp. EJY3]ALR18062.1 ABC transporter ATP-binding protein [Vibrio natriegens NBRC 15636 = ATCC 14048 = DSM 759]ANQ15562.1 choline ABC transporter ATP-binding protein [Vibrio natriegens NBRC 15636 = ATCC 14048 = DSM 759]ANQ19185.1 choline ABC transporter ATP-binding prot
MDAITIENLDVVFGQQQTQALNLLDQGKSRQEIIDETGQVVGVDNVSLSVKQGEICVLMGLSGSGKSSLLRTVNGLNNISRGSLKIKDGDDMVELANCDEQTLRHLRTHRVSMVFQKFALMPWLSVLDNVAFGLEMQGIGKAERREKARAQLEMVGLSEWENKFPHELSGGMQQRVGLARAFSMDTDILLMDEPFSALDPLIRAQLQDELILLQEKLNKTILFVSHDLDEALKIGNNIAIMESGKLIQHGKPEQIILTPENDYVADFVAHTNPLNVLKGRSLMQSCDALVRQEERVLICADKDIWVSQDPKGLRLIDTDKLLILWDSESSNLDDVKENTLVQVSPDISMREAIELKQRSNQPLLMVEDNQLVGILSDNELYNALLGNFRSDKVA